MKQINKEVLKETAAKLLFTLSEEEYLSLLKDFDVIIHQLDLINNIPLIEEALPLAFPYDFSISFLREDEPSSPLKVEEALRNAPSVKDHQIKIPKVIDK